MSTTSESNKRGVKRLRRTDDQLAIDYVEEQRKLQAKENIKITLMLCQGCQHVYTLAAKHRCELGLNTLASDVSDPNASINSGSISEIDNKQTSKKKKKKQLTCSVVLESQSSHHDTSTTLSNCNFPLPRGLWMNSVREVHAQCEVVMGSGLPIRRQLRKLISCTKKMQQFNQRLWQLHIHNQDDTRDYRRIAYFGPGVRVHIQTSETGYGKRVIFESDVDSDSSTSESESESSNNSSSYDGHN